jgi:hypothetical protein
VALSRYYTVFVIDLASRRVQIIGSTPHPNDLFTLGESPIDSERTERMGNDVNYRI